MDQFTLFCCKSCLRGDDNKEYYMALGFEPNNRSNISNDEIKKAYKKLSLTLHPDKLAQRGIEVTPQHKTDFLKLKEAYDVLSDPRKRRLYDQIGEVGFKLLENPSPSPETFTILLKNFQKNRVDVFYVACMVALIFGALFILPILFSMKCDGSLGSVPWIALWTPMWVVNLLFFIAAISLFTMNASGDVDEDGNEIASAKVPLSFKIFNMITTIAFILIQVFVMIRLDDETRWSWFSVFAPWFIYEGIWFISFLPSVTSTIQLPHDHDKANHHDDNIDESHLKAVYEYYEKRLNRWRDIRSMVTIMLRFWFAIFLALQLDNDVDWNWGLVMLPIWVYLFIQYVFVYYNRVWGYQLLQQCEEALIACGGDLESMDPMMAIRAKIGSELIQASGGDCLFQFFPIYLAILLVSRLQLEDFSTFIILLPIFMILGCCCCAVFCGLICFGSVDVDELSAAFADADKSDNPDQDDVEKQHIGVDAENIIITPTGAAGAYIPPIIPPASSSNQPSMDEVYPERAYGTFNNNSNSPPPPTNTESILVEID